MKKTLMVIALFVVTITAQQLRVISQEEILPGVTGEWNAPKFSSDGSKVFFTNWNWNGIWQYDRTSKQTSQITADAGSGFDFSISADGSSLLWRTTRIEPATRERIQTIKMKQLNSRATEQILAEGETVSAPVFEAGSPAFINGGTLHKNSSRAANMPVFLGIENEKIQLLVNGSQQTFDPYGSGSYIWVSISPDGNSVLGYEMRKGIFIASLDGTIKKELGTNDSPTFSHDGRFIIAADTRDNGQVITSSDLIISAADGSYQFNLTSSPDVIELYPYSSPTKNEVVYVTSTGKLFILSYEVK